MPQIGPLEILVVGVIALIVFGPEKLPQIARQIGKAATELRRMAVDVKQEFDAGLEDEEEVEDEKETAPPAEDPVETDPAGRREQATREEDQARPNREEES
jgi:Tat protein translocase TatB subunit